MKKAEIHIGNRLAGLLVENEDGFTFTYTPEYISQDNPQPVSLTLPVIPELIPTQCCSHSSTD